MEKRIIAKLVSSLKPQHQASLERDELKVDDLVILSTTTTLAATAPPAATRHPRRDDDSTTSMATVATPATEKEPEQEDDDLLSLSKCLVASTRCKTCLGKMLALDLKRVLFILDEHLQKQPFSTNVDAVATICTKCHKHPPHYQIPSLGQAMQPPLSPRSTIYDHML
jgi:hypothetical protein